MESVYEVLLADALREKGLSVERQKSIPMSAPWDRFLIAARSARLSATPVRKSAFALAGQWTEKILYPRFRCPPQLLPLTECSSKNLLHHRLFKAICDYMKLAAIPPPAFLFRRGAGAERQ